MHLCAPCSESRAAHKLSAKLNRDIIIGGSSLNTPQEFVEQLKVILYCSAHKMQSLLTVVLFDRCPFVLSESCQCGSTRPKNLDV